MARPPNKPLSRAAILDYTSPDPLAFGCVFSDGKELHLSLEMVQEATPPVYKHIQDYLDRKQSSVDNSNSIFGENSISKMTEDIAEFNLQMDKRFSDICCPRLDCNLELWHGKCLGRGSCERAKEHRDNPLSWEEHLKTIKDNVPPEESVKIFKELLQAAKDMKLKSEEKAAEAKKESKKKKSTTDKDNSGSGGLSSKAKGKQPEYKREIARSCDICRMLAFLNQHRELWNKEAYWDSVTDKLIDVSRTFGVHRVLKYFAFLIGGEPFIVGGDVDENSEVWTLVVRGRLCKLKWSDFEATEASSHQVTSGDNAVK